MADQRKGKMGPWISSASHDGNAEFKVVTVGTTAISNVKTDTRFPLSKPATNPHGPLLMRNPHATAKLWFRIDGIDPTAADTTSFRIDPGESIMIPSGVSDLRVIASAVSIPVHFILFF